MKKRGAFILLSLIFLLSLCSLSCVFADIMEVTYSNFFTGGIKCDRTSTTATWLNVSSGEVVNAALNCRLYTAIYGEDCCPLFNNICIDDGTCRGSGSFCNDFRSPYQCAGTGDAIARATLGPKLGLYCGEIYVNSTNGCEYGVSCKCRWNSVTESCNDTVMNYTFIEGGLCHSGRCEITSEIQNNCDNPLGNVVSKQVAIWFGGSPDVSCQNKTVPLVCPSVGRLDFTNNVGLAIIIALIILIYLYIYRKKKLASRKKKKK